MKDKIMASEYSASSNDDDVDHNISANYYLELLERFTPKGEQLSKTSTNIIIKCLTETPLIIVTTAKALSDLVHTLASSSIISVAARDELTGKKSNRDRLFLEISTAGMDYIIDTNILYNHLFKLRHIFLNPKILKVLFDTRALLDYLFKVLNLYVVNMFGVEVAYSVLNGSEKSFQQMIKHRCGKVDARAAKMTNMIRFRFIDPTINKKVYLRHKAHFLLPAYHRYKNALINKKLLLEFYKRCKQMCREYFGIMRYVQQPRIVSQGFNIMRVLDDETLGIVINDCLKKVDLIAVNVHTIRQDDKELITMLELSTGQAEFLIDAINLSESISQLAVIFEDHRILKVMYQCVPVLHNLLRLLNLRVFNIFDLAESFKPLKLNVPTFTKILKVDCSYTNSNEVTSWKIRSSQLSEIPSSLINYFAEKSHFLCHLFYTYMAELKTIGAYDYVLNRSNAICKEIYEAPYVIPMSIRLSRELKGRHIGEKMILQQVFEWREKLAREKQQHPNSILSLQSIENLLRHLPITEQELTEMCLKVPEYDYAKQILEIIMECIGKVKGELGIEIPKYHPPNVTQSQQCDQESTNEIQIDDTTYSTEPQPHRQERTLTSEQNGNMSSKVLLGMETLRKFAHCDANGDYNVKIVISPESRSFEIVNDGLSTPSTSRQHDSGGIGEEQNSLSNKCTQPAVASIRTEDSIIQTTIQSAPLPSHQILISAANLKPEDLQNTQCGTTQPHKPIELKSDRNSSPVKQQPQILEAQLNSTNQDLSGAKPNNTMVITTDFIPLEVTAIRPQISLPHQEDTEKLYAAEKAEDVQDKQHTTENETDTCRSKEEFPVLRKQTLEPTSQPSSAVNNQTIINPSNLIPINVLNTQFPGEVNVLPSPLPASQSGYQNALHNIAPLPILPSTIFFNEEPMPLAIALPESEAALPSPKSSDFVRKSTIRIIKQKFAYGNLIDCQRAGSRVTSVQSSPSMQTTRNDPTVTDVVGSEMKTEPSNASTKRDNDEDDDVIIIQDSGKKRERPAGIRINPFAQKCVNHSIREEITAPPTKKQRRRLSFFRKQERQGIAVHSERQIDEKSGGFDEVPNFTAK